MLGSTMSSPPTLWRSRLSTHSRSNLASPHALASSTVTPRALSSRCALTMIGLENIPCRSAVTSPIESDRPNASVCAMGLGAYCS